MRILKNSGLIHDADYAKFPGGAIKNETTAAEGTPVVREVYGDQLMNFYALLKDRGIDPNGLEDNELNGYQIIEALKLLTNQLNDKEQVLSLNAGSWQVGLKFGLLPDKYFVFAKASENYDSEIIFIKGNDDVDVSYPFSSAGFSVGDELLLILNQAGAVAYNLSAMANISSASELSVPFGTPIPFASKYGKVWYQENGKIFSDLPELYNLQQVIQEHEGNENIVLYEVFLIGSNFLCSTYDTDGNAYKFFNFISTDFNTPIGMDFDGFDLSDNGGEILNMHVYASTAAIYLSNYGDAAVEDYKFIKCVIDFENNLIIKSGEFELHDSFENTTNAVISDEAIYTLVNGNISKFLFTGAAPTQIISFDSLVGVIFNVKGSYYYSNGEIARKWNFQ